MKKQIPLEMNGSSLYIDYDIIKHNCFLLEAYLKDEKDIKTRAFAKKILLSNEVQSNNSVEGYYDDIDSINEIVNKRSKTKEKSEREKRIINLYNGYKYVLKDKEINKNTLKELYSILSEGLLEKQDLEHMGEFYRNDDVFIFYSDDLSKAPDKGVDKRDIERLMNFLFNFINDDSFSENETLSFIKSQIIHIYFVYIHPYFDINGRCSRTTSLWHLLNKEAYPYVIFNRGIELHKKDYYKNILDAKKFHDITYFINYMLQITYQELKKEHAIMYIEKMMGEKLTEKERQTLGYVFSMNGVLSVLDFATIYNRYNDKKRSDIIHSEMIKPLIEKEIIIPGRSTNRFINRTDSNYLFSVNPTLIDDSKDTSGILALKKKL